MPYYRRRARSKRAETSVQVSKEPSELEREFETLARQLELPEYVREYQFMKSRKFASEFAWPNLKIIVEIEGGIGTGGRHTRVMGYSKDCEKYNYISMKGWVLLRFTAPMLKDGRADNQLRMAFGIIPILP
jgi:very-short-patch-repair endonuclease